MGIEDLYLREFARLTRALAVAGDADQAADAVQDAFLAADRRWERVSHLDDPAGWVRRAAVNRLSNHRRDHRRRTSLLAAVRPVDPVDLDPLDLDLLAAVRALPERQRIAVCLHYVAGLSVEEVAAALGSSPGTVKSNLHDARRNLRVRLEVSDDVC